MGSCVRRCVGKGGECAGEDAGMFRIVGCEVNGAGGGPLGMGRSSVAGGGRNGVRVRGRGVWVLGEA